jgi:hypothetical protein
MSPITLEHQTLLKISTTLAGNYRFQASGSFADTQRREGMLLMLFP